MLYERSESRIRKVKDSRAGVVASLEQEEAYALATGDTFDAQRARRLIEAVKAKTMQEVIFGGVAYEVDEPASTDQSRADSCAP